MFIGEYSHNIDTKGRLIIPAKFREDCGEGAVITRGNDGCIALYTETAWNDYYQRLLTLPTNEKKARAYFRRATSNALNVEFDKLGRVTIPAKLREKANLVKECTIIGVGNHVEIWNEELWNAFNDENDDIDEYAEEFEGFGW